MRVNSENRHWHEPPGLRHEMAFAAHSAISRRRFCFRIPLYATDTAPVDNSVGAGRRNRASQMQVITNVTDTAPATG